jgi:hypothetical protein
LRNVELPSKAEESNFSEFHSSFSAKLQRDHNEYIVASSWHEHHGRIDEHLPCMFQTLAADAERVVCSLGAL